MLASKLGPLCDLLLANVGVGGKVKLGCFTLGYNQIGYISCIGKHIISPLSVLRVSSTVDAQSTCCTSHFSHKRASNFMLKLSGFAFPYISYTTCPMTSPTSLDHIPPILSLGTSNI